MEVSNVQDGHTAELRLGPLRFLHFLRKSGYVLARPKLSRLIYRSVRPSGNTLKNRETTPDRPLRSACLPIHSFAPVK